MRGLSISNGFQTLCLTVFFKLTPQVGLDGVRKAPKAKKRKIFRWQEPIDGFYLFIYLFIFDSLQMDGKLPNCILYLIWEKCLTSVKPRQFVEVYIFGTIRGTKQHNCVNLVVLVGIIKFELLNT